METGETGETLFFIAIGIRGLACEKNSEILQIFQKCYFFIHFPKMELAGAVAHPLRGIRCSLEASVQQLNSKMRETAEVSAFVKLRDS